MCLCNILSNAFSASNEMLQVDSCWRGVKMQPMVSSSYWVIANWNWERFYVLKYDLHNAKTFCKHISFVAMLSCLKYKMKCCLFVFLFSITLLSFLAMKVRNHWSCAVRSSRMVKSGWKPFTKPGMGSNPQCDTRLSGSFIRMSLLVVALEELAVPRWVTPQYFPLVMCEMILWVFYGYFF